MSSFIIERAIDIVKEIQTELDECCETTMDKDEIEQLLSELEQLLQDIRNQYGE